MRRDSRLENLLRKVLDITLNERIIQFVDTPQPRLGIQGQEMKMNEQISKREILASANEFLSYISESSLNLNGYAPIYDQIEIDQPEKGKYVVRLYPANDGGSRIPDDVRRVVLGVEFTNEKQAGEWCVRNIRACRVNADFCHMYIND